MKYVFDTNVISAIFGHYFFSRFPSFWIKFNVLKDKRDIISVKEVKKELEEKEWGNEIEKWISENIDFFEIPTAAEGSFITEIYRIPHFQQNMDKKKQLKGGAFADPFIIAKAKINNGIVVTQELYKKNSANIPNICEKFKIECVDLEGFLTREKWKF